MKKSLIICLIYLFMLVSCKGVSNEETKFYDINNMISNYNVCFVDESNYALYKETSDLSYLTSKDSLVSGNYYLALISFDIDLDIYKGYCKNTYNKDMDFLQIFVTSPTTYYYDVYEANTTHYEYVEGHMEFINSNTCMSVNDGIEVDYNVETLSGVKNIQIDIIFELLSTLYFTVTVRNDSYFYEFDILEATKDIYVIDELECEINYDKSKYLYTGSRDYIYIVGYTGNESVINVNTKTPSGRDINQISSGAFSNLTNLNEIIIDKKIKLSPNIFDKNTNLKSITITLLEDEEIAKFFGTTSMFNSTSKSYSTGYGTLTVYIPNTLDTVKINEGSYLSKSAFSNVSSIKYIYLPHYLERIASRAFSGTNIDKIYYDGTKSEFDSLSKGNEWNYGLTGVTLVCSDCEITID